MLFSIGFAWVNVTGQLYLFEIILLFAAVVGAARSQRLRLPRELRWLLVLALVWLWFQVLSDLLHGSSLHDYARGWLKLSFS